MTPVAACPSRPELEALLQGQVPFAQVEKLAQHLETCAACVQTIQTLKVDDTLVEIIRRQTPGKPRDAVLKSVMERLHVLRASRSHETAGVSATGGVGAPPASETDQELYDFLTPPQAADEIGRLGPYRVLKVLGAGGMGVVFEAEDPHLKRKVALKAMRPALAASSTAKQRFVREAQSTAAIKHDHIVTIYQVGEDRGIPYLAMEFLEGAALDVWLKKGRKPTLAQILRIGREMARGLAAAHQRGLVHRDIKPANVWLEAPQGRVKILDFGLARGTKDDSQLTQSGAIVGTPAYMSPEQANGHKVDHRTDLFSLGCVLYRLCTGQMPFKGETTMATLMCVVTEHPRAVHEVNPKIPRVLSDLITQLLAKDPAGRPGSARDVVEAIQAIEREQSTAGVKGAAAENPAASLKDATQSITQDYVPQRSWRRPLLLLGAVAASLLFLLAAGGVVFVQTDKGTLKIDTADADVQVLVAQNGKVVAVLDKKTGREVKLRSGEYTLKLGEENKDVRIDKGVIKLTRGGTVVATITRAKEASEFALAFNGTSNYVVVPGWTYKGEHPLTIETWVVLGRPIGGQPVELLMGDPQQAGLSIENAGAKSNFTLWAGGYVKAETIQPVPRHQLVHLAGVYDGKSEIRFYVDGSLQSRTAAKKPFRASTMPFTLGANPEQDGKFVEHFLGRMNKVRISKVERYQRDFTPARHFEPDAATLVLYGFDEGQGDVLKDSSGNGHHGKIFGAQWVKADASPPITDPSRGVSDDWVKDVQKLPAEKQLEAVITKLKELNPHFDGKESHKLDKDGVVRELEFVTDNVTDISPLRALPGLRTLNISSSGKYYEKNSRLTDLAPLKGMQLRHLYVRGTAVFDLSPLQGMKLAYLGCGYTKVVDLEPLKDMRLDWLDFCGTLVHDLSPLKNMKLSHLGCLETPVADLSPLKDMKLKSLNCARTLVSDLSQIKGMPLKDIYVTFNPYRDTDVLRSIRTLETINGKPAADFWNAVESDNGAFEQWLKETQKLPAEKQAEAVVAKLKELNPKFDGKVTHWIDGRGRLAHLQFHSKNVTDISPVRALPELRLLECAGTLQNPSAFSDLSPLQGMELDQLNIASTQVKDLSPLRGMKTMKRLFCNGSLINDLSPLAGMRLEQFQYYGTSVKDISVLRDMPLEQVWWNQGEGERDILRSIPTLKIVQNRPADVYWKEVDAKGSLDAWIKDVQKLPAEKRVEAVVAKLKELNPGFDGKVDFNYDPAMVAKGLNDLRFSTDSVSDISPVRALSGMRNLRLILNGSGPGKGRLADLSPLQGLHVSLLEARNNPIVDLRPLEGLPIAYLYLTDVRVTDLRPLTRLRHLQGLHFWSKQKPDLQVFRHMSLKHLLIDGEWVTPEVYPLLQSLWLEGIQNQSPVTFWKKHDPKHAAYLQWIEDARKLPAEKQVEEVRKKLMERNSGFDGKLTHKMLGDAVDYLAFPTDAVTDISPVRALPKLRTLQISGSAMGKGKLADLTPLRGMKLVWLYVQWNAVTDYTPLRDMPLKMLLCDFKADRGAEVLRSIKTLDRINGMSAEEFWKKADAK